MTKFVLSVQFLKSKCPSFQAKCLETGETVAIKKVLQDKRYKNRELQLMRLMDHPNVVSLKHCFFSTTSKDELFLNLVMEYVPQNMYHVLKHYNSMNQRMPLIYVKLYTYQVGHTISFTIAWTSGGFCLYANTPVVNKIFRSLGALHIFIQFLGSAIGMWSLKIFWYDFSP